MRVSWPVAAGGGRRVAGRWWLRWRGHTGHWHQNSSGCCRHRAAALLVLATTPPPPPATPPLTNTLHTHSLHFKFHFKLNPHYTISRLHEGWWSSPSTPAARLQWTLCYLYKNMMFVSESWIIDIWRDARTRSSEDTEDMSQGDSLNWNHHLTTDWCLAGPSWGDVRRFLGQGSPDLLQTTTHRQSHSHNEYSAKKYFRSEKYLILGRARSPKNEG